MIFVHQKKLYIMKTKNKRDKNAVRPENGFDTVKTFRKIKEDIAKETENMSFEQFQAYLKKNQLADK